jgi:hypothetical protein
MPPSPQEALPYVVERNPEHLRKFGVSNPLFVEGMGFLNIPGQGAGLFSGVGSSVSHPEI